MFRHFQLGKTRGHCTYVPVLANPAPSPCSPLSVCIHREYIQRVPGIHAWVVVVLLLLPDFRSCDPEVTRSLQTYRYWRSFTKLFRPFSSGRTHLLGQVATAGGARQLRHHHAFPEGHQQILVELGPLPHLLWQLAQQRQEFRINVRPWAVGTFSQDQEELGQHHLVQVDMAGPILERKYILLMMLFLWRTDTTKIAGTYDVYFLINCDAS